MATEGDCQAALDRLAVLLGELDPAVRAKHVPNRTVACSVSDLGVTFTGRVDESGVHDVVRRTSGVPATEVRISVASNDLVALANGDDDLLSAWLRGRLQISAPMRDMLRLRTLIGL